MPLSTHRDITRRVLCLAAAVLCTVPTVHAEPTPSDFVPVVVDVTVRDENGVPMQSMHVSAVSHEYGFRVESMSDANGVAQLNLMSGTWAFFSTPDWGGLWTRPGKGYYLTKGAEAVSPSSNTVTLQPTAQIRGRVSSSVFDFSSRDVLFGFVALPYGRYIEARFAGVTQTTDFVLHTSSGLQGRAHVVSFQQGAESLFFTDRQAALTSPLTVHIDATNSGVLSLTPSTATARRAHPGCYFTTRTVPGLGRRSTSRTHSNRTGFDYRAEVTICGERSSPTMRLGLTRCA